MAVIACQWQTAQAWADGAGLDVSIFDDPVLTGGASYIRFCDGEPWVNETLATPVIEANS